MTQLDLGVFLVAGILGSAIDNRFAWILVGVWSLLKLLKVLG